MRFHHVPPVLPLAPRPRPGELRSGWLRRVAAANAVPFPELLDALTTTLPDDFVETLSLDHRVPRHQTICGDRQMRHRVCSPASHAGKCTGHEGSRDGAPQRSRPAAAGARRAGKKIFGEHEDGHGAELREAVMASKTQTLKTNVKVKDLSATSGKSVKGGESNILKKDSDTTSGTVSKLG